MQKQILHMIALSLSLNLGPIMTLCGNFNFHGYQAPERNIYEPDHADIYMTPQSKYKSSFRNQKIWRIHASCFNGSNLRTIYDEDRLLRLSTTPGALAENLHFTIESHTNTAGIIFSMDKNKTNNYLYCLNLDRDGANIKATLRINTSMSQSGDTHKKILEEVIPNFNLTEPENRYFISFKPKAFRENNQIKKELTLKLFCSAGNKSFTKELIIPSEHVPHQLTKLYYGLVANTDLEHQVSFGFIHSTHNENGKSYNLRRSPKNQQAFETELEQMQTKGYSPKEPSKEMASVTTTEKESTKPAPTPPTVTAPSMLVTEKPIPATPITSSPIPSSQSREEISSNQKGLSIDGFGFGRYQKRTVTYPETQIINLRTSQIVFDVDDEATNIGLALSITNSPNQHTCFISIKGDSGIQKKAIRSSAYVSDGSLFENVNYQKHIPYEGSLGGSYTASINKEDGSVTLKKGTDFSHTFPCERLMNRKDIYYNLVSQNPETNPVHYRNVRTEALSIEKKALLINTKPSPLHRIESANPTPKETASLLSSTSVDKVSPQETTITLPPTSSPQSREEISSNQEGLSIHGFGFGSYQKRTVTYSETQTIDLSKNQILTFTVPPM